MSDWTVGDSTFKPGDKVWPVAGGDALQYAPQTVIATASHPTWGEWLWLAYDRGVSSHAAVNWTTEEPDHEERVRRLKAQAARAQENWNWNARKYIPVIPALAGVPTGWECPRCRYVWSPHTSQCSICVPFTVKMPRSMMPSTHSVSCTGFTTCPSPREGGMCGCDEPE